MNNTPDSSPKKTPQEVAGNTPATPLRSRNNVRANAIWLMNAAALAIAVSGAVHYSTPNARASWYLFDSNGTNAGLSDTGGGNLGVSSGSAQKTTHIVSSLSSYTTTTAGTNAAYFGNTANDVLMVGSFGYSDPVPSAATGSATTAAVRWGSSSGANAPTLMGAIILQRSVGGAFFQLGGGTAITTSVATNDLTAGVLQAQTTGFSTQTGTVAALGNTLSTGSYLTSSTSTSIYNAGGGITIYQKSDVTGANIFANGTTAGGYSSTVTSGGLEFNLTNNQAFVNLSNKYDLRINVRLAGLKALTTYGDIVLGGGNTNGGVNALSALNIDAGTLTLAGANSITSTTPITVNGASGASVGRGNVNNGSTGPATIATLRLTGGVTANSVTFTGSTTNASSFGNLVIDARAIGSASAGYAFDKNATAATTSARSSSSTAGNITLTGTSGATANYTLDSSITKQTVAGLTLSGYSNITFAGTLGTTAASAGISADTLTVSGVNNIITLNGNSGNPYASGNYRILTVTGAPSITANSLSITGTAMAGATISLNSSATVGRSTYSFSSASVANAYDFISAAVLVPVKWNSANATGTWSTALDSGNWLRVSDSGSDNFYAGDAVTFDTAATVTTSGTVSAGAVTISNASGTVGISGTQVAATSLSKSGAGSATIGSVNVSGITSVSNGTLTLSGGTTGGAITVSGGTLTTSATGSGGATVNGGTLNANAAISGGATVSSGTLNANAVISGGVTVSGGTLNANTAVSGAVSVSSGTLNYGVTSATPGALTVSGGTVDISTYSGTAASVILSGGRITGSSGVLTSTAAFDARSGTVSAILGGTSGLTKTTSDTVVLSGNNVYSGNTAINAGTLRLGGTSALGASTVSSILAGGSLDLNGNSISGTTITSFAGNITNSSTQSAAFNGDISLSGTTASISADAGNIYVNNLTTGNNVARTITLTGTNNGTVAGTIGSYQNSSNYTAIVKEGTGTWLLAGNNAPNPNTNGIVYNQGGVSNVTIKQGTIKMGNVSALGRQSASNVVDVQAGGVLDLNGFSQSANSQTLKLSGTGPAGGVGGALVNSSNVASAVFGPGFLAADAAIIANSGITISATSSIRAFEVGTGLNLTLGGSATDSTFNSAIYGAGRITKVGSGTWYLNPTNNLSANTVNGTTYTPAAINTNAFTGGITINEGTLRIGSANALGAASGAVAVTSNGALDLFGQTVSNTNPLSLAGAGASSAGALTNSSTTTASYAGALALTGNASIKATSGNINLSNTGNITGTGFTLTLDGTSNGTLSGNLNIGNGGLTKTGAGTWSILGNNTYTGATAINQGRLLISGTTAAGSTVTVGSSGTLLGTGNIQGRVDVSGAINPGSAGIGNLKTGELHLVGGGTLNVQFFNSGTGAGTGWDLISTTGGVVVDATSSSKFTINLISISNASSDTQGLANLFASGSDSSYKIIDGAVTGFGLDKFSLVTSSTTTGGFTNPLSGGNWGLATDLGGVSGLYLTFTASTLQYWSGTNLWDGTTNAGGTGTWNDGDAGYNSGSATVFAGQAGVVTLDTVTANKGIKFSTTGYSLANGTLTISGSSDSDNTITTDSDVSATIASNIVAATKLTKGGAGTLVLSGNNSGIGANGIAVTAGTLQLGSANAIGTGTVAISAGAALDLAGQNISATNALIISGTGPSASSGAITNTGSSASYAGLVTLSGAATVNASSGDINLSNTGAITGAGNRLTLSGASNGTLAGSLQNTTGGLTKTGAGTWLISGANNTYTGSTQVSAGTLKLGAASALGSSASTIAAGASLDLNGYSLSNNIAINGTGPATGSAAILNTGSSATLSGAVTMGTSASIGGSGDITITGTIAATANTALLTKTGSGTLNLNSTAGTNFRNMSIDAGVVKLGSTTALNAAAVRTGYLIINSGGQLDINGNSQTLASYDSLISISGTGPTGGAIINSSSNAVSLNTTMVVAGNASIVADSGAITLVGSTASYKYMDLKSNTLTLGGISTNASTIGNSISGTGSIVKNGTGIWYLTPSNGTNSSVSSNFSTILGGTVTTTTSNTNIYSGGTTINGGVLVAGAGGAFGTGNITVNSGGTLDLNGRTVTGMDVANSLTLSGTGAAGVGGALISSTGAATFSNNVVIGTTGATVGGSSGITLAGTVSGTGALTKSGSSTLTLSGVNTLSGGISVNGGTLKLGNASALGNSAGAVSVAQGAALDLSGFSPSNSNQLTIAGTGVSSTGALTNSSSTDSTYTGDIILADNSLIQATTGGISLSGVISGTGKALTVSAVSGKTVSFTGAANANTFSGGLVLAGGDVRFSQANQLGSGTITSTDASSRLQFIGTSAPSEITNALNTGTSASTTLAVAPGTGNTVTLSGRVSGSGQLKISSGGTLIVSDSSNEYTGGTEIGTGTIQVSNASALGSGTVNFGTTNSSILAFTETGTSALNFTIGSSVTPASTFIANIDVASGKTVTLSGTIANTSTGAGSLVKTGSGTLSLASANTYTGSTTVSAGTLDAASGALANTSGITVSGGSLTAVNYNSSASLSVTGSAVANISGTDLTVGALTNNNTASNSLNFSGTTGSISAASLSGTGNTRFGSNATITGGISSGTVTVVGALTGTAITGGTVSAQTLSGTSISGSTSVVNISGTSASAASLSGTISGGANVTVAGGLTVGSINNTSTVVSAGSLDVTAGVTNSQSVTITGNATVRGSGTAISNAAMTVGGDLTLTTGNIGGTSNVGVGGTITGVSVTNGTIAAGALNLSGNISTANLTVTNAATFVSMTSGSLTAGSVTASGTVSGGAISVGSNSSINVLTGGNVAIGSGATLTVSSGTTAGILSGAGSLAKTSSGALRLTGANTYTGTTTVSAGTLDAASGALANTSGITLNGGTNASTTFTAVNFGSSAGVSLSVDSSGTATISGTGLSVGALSNANTASNSLNFTGATGTISAASLAGAGSTRFGSNATIRTGDVSNGTLNVVGALTLTDGSITGGSVNANSLSGTGISGGTVTTAANANLTGNISGTAQVNVLGLLAAGSITGGTIAAGALSATSIAGGSTTVSGTSALGAISSGTVNFNGNATVGSLTGGAISVASAKTLTVSSGTTAGVISGQGSLTKTGNGALQLSGVNTYSGTTAVTAGTLNLSGSIANSALTISNGATVTATNSIGTNASSASVNVGSITTNSNSTINVLAGSLKAGSMTVGANTPSVGDAVINYSIGNTIALTGALTLTGNIGINLSTLVSSANAGTYNVLTFADGWTGNAGNIVLNNTWTSDSADWVASGELLANAYQITIRFAFVSGDPVTSGNLTVPTGSNVGAVSGTATVTTNAGTTPLSVASINSAAGGRVTLNGSANTVTTIASAGEVEINGNTTITTLTSGTVAVKADTIVEALNGGALTIDSGKKLSVASGDSAGTLAGSGTLEKTGDGILKLSGDNSSFAGAAKVNEGTLEVTSANALGSATNVDLGVSGNSAVAALKFSGTTPTTISTDINALSTASGGNQIQNAGGGLLTLAGDLTKNGTVLTLNGGSNGINVTGVIGGTSASGFNSDLVVSNGTTTLSNANTYDGPTYVNNGGVLVNGVTNALPTDTNLVLGSGTTSGAYNLNGYNQSVANLNTNGTAGTSNIITNGAAANGTATLTVSGSTTASSFAGLIQDGSATKKTALAVTGGELTLKSNNTFTGGITVTGGTLLAGAASALGDNAITVSTGGTLAAGDGSRTSTGVNALTVSGGSLILSDGARLRVYIGSMGNNNSPTGYGLEMYYDQSAYAGVNYTYFDLSGGLDLSGLTPGNKVTIELYNDGTPIDWVASRRYNFTFMSFDKTLLSGANALSISNLFTFDASQLNVNGLPGGTLGDWGINAYMMYNDTTGTLTMSIPEPSTYGFGLGALALAFAAIRRRRMAKAKANQVVA